MSKYEPLKTFLARQDSAEVPMRFSEIEQILGVDLPPSAFKHRAWWSNNPSNSVITQAWLGAGYKTERVDVESGRLVFRRRETRTAVGAVQSSGRKPNLIEALQEALGGTVRVAPGFDLTTPTSEIWDAETQ